MWSDIDTERKKSGARKEGEWRMDAEQQFSVSGEKRDPMISDPVLSSVYIFAPHGTKGAGSNA